MITLSTVPGLPLSLILREWIETTWLLSVAISNGSLLEEFIESQLVIVAGISTILEELFNSSSSLREILE